MALFGHKINYISPVFGFCIIKCNQKRVRRIPIMSLHSIKYRETFSRFLFDHAEIWHIFAGVSALHLCKDSPTLSYDNFFFSSREIYVIRGRKNIFGGFFHDQNFALTGILFIINIVRNPSTTYSGTHTHDPPINARFESSAASRWEMRSSGLLSSEYS